MPGLLDSAEQHVRKRKRDGHTALSAPTANATTLSGEGDGKVEVEVLENQIVESRRHYNNISTLITYVLHPESNFTRASQAIAALCRVFSRLMASGLIKNSDHQTESEVFITDWLKQRFHEYRKLLVDSLADGRHAEQKACLEHLMRISKEEAAGLCRDGVISGHRGTFPLILRALTTASCSDQVRGYFVKDYLRKFDDIIVYTFKQITYVEQACIIIMYLTSS